MDGKSCHDARGKRPHFLSPRLQKQIVPRQRKNSVRECGACSLSPNGRGALPATTVKGNYTAHVAIGPVFPIPILTGRRKGQACVGVAFLCSEAKRIWLRLCKIPSIRHRGGRRENPFWNENEILRFAFAFRDESGWNARGWRSSRMEIYQFYLFVCPLGPEVEAHGRPGFFRNVFLTACLSGTRGKLYSCRWSGGPWDFPLSLLAQFWGFIHLRFLHNFLHRAERREHAFAGWALFGLRE